MGAWLSTIKCLSFMFNILCLILGLGIISVGITGLEYARPSTDEHSYFIVAIILGSLLGMVTFFGCYGIVCEQIGVNLIYAFFMSMLFIMQILQMRAYRPVAFFQNSLENLQNSWQMVESQPNYMETLESDYHCCALYNSHDYKYKGMATPKSCYYDASARENTEPYTRGCLEALQAFYKSAAHRNYLFNVTLIIVEGIVFVYAIVMSIMIYLKNRTEIRFMEQEIEALPEPRLNHVTSRTHLLSN
ncbi:protein late bloomer-like [Teleopsis dalmanni]|uniref:protein late bloomer-like n=1 Tax=Teleopsis dalmanni TaxID=139649 RepID=UPI0018CE27E4|nr:protein late bloomer-like [Teleopsis dalmanni]